MKFLMPILHDRPLARLLIACASYKAIIFLLVVITFSTYGIREVEFNANFHWPEESTPTLATAFSTWDAQHYIYLAQEWYSAGHISNAFYPLYPLLIRLLNVLTFNHTLITGLLLSTVFSFAAVAMLFLLARRAYGDRVAMLAGLLFMAFPTAFYLHLVYTESLFILLVLASFYFLGHKDAWKSYLAMFLLPLTRPQGVFTAVPLLYRSLVRWKRGKLMRSAMIITAFAGGVAAYLCIMHFSTGSAFSGFMAQGFFYTNYSIENLLHPVDWITRNFIHLEPSFHALNTSIIDRVFFIGFLAGLPLVYKYTKRSLFIFTLLLGLVTALSGDLSSFPRYMLLLFPLFIALARWLKNREFAFRFIQWSFIMLQMIGVVAYSMSLWVA
ncbi:MAG: hypothetical protein ABIG66_01195 [Candidatus Kerfeldbacteria bacterium]